MGQRKVNALDPVADTTAANNMQLIPLADPGTGVSGKMTVAQAKAVFASYKVKYVATGSEGTVLNVPALVGKEIILATRESGSLYEVLSSPDTVEFIFDNATGDITLGVAVGGPGERFNFIYKTPA